MNVERWNIVQTEPTEQQEQSGVYSGYVESRRRKTESQDKELTFCWGAADIQAEGLTMNVTLTLTKELTKLSKLTFGRLP